jgi:hypothetical protein
VQPLTPLRCVRGSEKCVKRDRVKYYVLAVTSESPFSASLH